MVPRSINNSIHSAISKVWVSNVISRSVLNTGRLAVIHLPTSRDVFDTLPSATIEIVYDTISPWAKRFIDAMFPRMSLVSADDYSVTLAPQVSVADTVAILNGRVVPVFRSSSTSALIGFPAAIVRFQTRDALLLASDTTI